MFDRIKYSPGTLSLSINQVSEMFCVSRQTIYKWRKRGMPYIVIGGTVRFSYEEIMNWVNDQNNSNGNSPCRKAGLSFTGKS